MALELSDFSSYSFLQILDDFMDKQDEKINVLHIDDDEDLLYLSKIFLEENGKTIVTNVESPEKALELLETEQFDCVITDYQMPVMNGLQLSSIILEKHDIPIIIYTGRGSEEVAEKAFKTGVTDYLRKEETPGHITVLSKRVESIVRKRKTEDKLKEKNQQLQTIYNNIPISLVLIDSEFKVKRFNKTALTRIEGTGANLVPRCCGDLFGCIYSKQDVSECSKAEGCDFCELREIIRETITSQSVHKQIELPVKVVRGENVFEKTLLVSTIPIGFNEQVMAIVSLEDITDYLAERELNKCLLENAPYPIVILDEMGVLQSVNQETLTSFGYSRDELLGKAFTELLFDEDIHRLSDEFQLAVEGRYLDKPIEMKIRCSDGSAKWVEVRASRYVEKGLIRLLTIFVDITDRVVNIQRLKNLQSHFVEIAKCNSLEEVYSVTQSSMEDILGFDRPDVLMVEGDYLVQVIGSDRLPQGFTIPLDGGGVTARVVKEKRSVLVNDVRESVDYIYVAPDEPCFDNFILSSSELCCPIVVDDIVVGVLNIESPVLSCFDDKDMLMLEILASHVGLAFKRITEKNRA